MARRRFSAVDAAPGFPGFPVSLFHFLEDLARNNHRDWFASHKLRHQTDVVEPALAFIRAIQPTIHRLSPYLQAIPQRTGGSLLRLHRDTRFTKDKTPYKHHVGIHFRHEFGGGIHAPAYYLHLEPGQCFLGAGIWMPPAEPLTQIRQGIVDNPSSWKRACNYPNFRERFRLDGESLKTAPRGFPKDHPLIDDLKRKSFAGLMPIDQQELHGPASLKAIGEAYRAARPLMKFLCDALNLPF
jgi:uncharacterized protein (TIGR02453 family)